ncbi:p-loop containing nucleoside triphosphate hydrolase protein [Venustampulla echinocandica]|uniref:p-loop containing nucleoside triphosphate hydrolase protein n=1 Tax=Venustampulla echinocandica TaxID=2656787 RepID=A0A370TNW9_9HELO|nr:p-loop containing nucleoside triphosphate hydrolase protein [Venustampulla echinocandica]RDL37213.1 p-loop containing nucleoside triphosphate hydrolase protein [Venustampulla echinocandica]
MDSQTHSSSMEECGRNPPQDAFSVDIESKAVTDTHLMNYTVQNFVWSGVTVTVNDNKTGQPKAILDNIDGLVEAGEMCALMGPSGCGKTTLLNVLARRDAAASAKVEGAPLINGNHPTLQNFRRLTSYVEQEDALIGSLTVKETMHFAARLAHKNSLSKTERISRINALLESFGLKAQENNIVGTPIRKGISGGQKRRLSVASQLITAPKILFLDEPTSGLDSAASFEVMSFVKDIAKTNNLIVIASIHQPSTTTFGLFDKLILLSQGKTQYFGAVGGIDQHFASLGFPMPTHTNPAEFILELINIDFATDQAEAEARLQTIQNGWSESSGAAELSTMIDSASQPTDLLPPTKPSTRTFFVVLSTLVHRSFVKSYRDVVAYGIRIAMYLGLAIMMGTVWLRLDADQSSIQPFINAIFFGGAFMSFMAVAYVPSFLEDRATFVKERANGLYGPSAFMLSNFIIGLPYLFLITILFSVVVYWLSNFNPTATAFFTWIMWLFLDLVAAESLVVLMSSLFPNFVVSLALTAFANGLWMSVNGFMVPPHILNVFWRYVFHYIDYQSYVFQGMMVNEFEDRSYSCGTDCNCMYQTELASQCRVAGTAVLDQYGFKTGRTGKWVGILIGIIAVYRLLGLLVLVLRKK